MPETDHWNSKLEKNTQCEKTYHSSFSTLQKLFKKINKKIISDIFWAYKSWHGCSPISLLHISRTNAVSANWGWFIRLLTLHCFFLTLLYFYIFSTIYPYLSLLFSHFVFSFLPCFFTFLSTSHILQYTMFDSISLQPARNNTRWKNTL